MTDEYTASEFREMIKTGQITFDKKGKAKKAVLSTDFVENLKDSGVTLLDSKSVEKSNKNAKIMGATNCSDLTKINIKPLSVNEAFKGRRFHTEKHKKWKRIVTSLLPDIIIPTPPFEIYFKFGFSSTSSDWDNCIKQVQDCLADKYGFNDKLIRKGIVETEIVKKGEEYFIFSIKHLSV